MIETDQQRRWWFATHPEYSGRRSGRGNKGRGSKDEDSDKIVPEKVDDWAEERLKHERDPVGIELLKQAKFWFGSEFASKPPGEQYALLWGDDESVGSDDLFGGKSDDDSSPQQILNLSVSSVDSDDDPPDSPQLSAEEQARQIFVDEMMHGGATREWAESRWRLHKQNDSIARSTAWAVEVVGAGQALVGAYRWAKALGAAGAIGRSGGPGKWVEVGRRGGPSLEHQSKMSGQPIIESGGKYRIKEYAIPTKGKPVVFDDYRDGKLYEYKAEHGHLFDKNNDLNVWVGKPEQFRDEALGQARAAKGIPVIWEVDPKHVDAFKKAVGDIPGISIVPWREIPK